MIRDYDNITPEQEAAETIIFGQWWDWFFEEQGISQDTELKLDCGIRTIRQYKDMFMREFPLQESALTYLPGVAIATDRETFIEYIRGVANDFVKIGFMR